MLSCLGLAAERILQRCASASRHPVWWRRCQHIWSSGRIRHEPAGFVAAMVLWSRVGCSADAPLSVPSFECLRNASRALFLGRTEQCQPRRRTHCGPSRSAWWVPLAARAQGGSHCDETCSGKMTLKCAMMDPGAHFQNVVDEARAVIIAGGTMQPVLSPCLTGVPM